MHGQKNIKICVCARVRVRARVCVDVVILYRKYFYGLYSVAGRSPSVTWWGACNLYIKMK